MEIILLHDIEKLGSRGDKKSVADGYARNYLFPQGLAVRADTAKVKELEMRLKAFEARDERGLGDAQKNAQALAGFTLVLSGAASDDDKLYGSVSSQMIAAGLVEAGHKVKPRQVLLPEPIRQLGTFTVPVRIHREVTVDVEVEVKRI
jgi:large subunit ribosomal protein L9